MLFSRLTNSCGRVRKACTAACQSNYRVHYAMKTEKRQRPVRRDGASTLSSTGHTAPHEWAPPTAQDFAAGERHVANCGWLRLPEQPASN